MRYNFTADEMNVLLTSLVARRNTIIELIESIPSYSEKLQEIEAVMEKLFPGSVEVLRENNQAS